MTRPAITTREAIVEAGVELVRELGHEQLNARSLAKRLGCSTQPILYQFSNMDELRRAIYAAADARHSAYLASGLAASSNPLLQMGLNYVRFADREPALFRFLFQTDGLGERDVAALIASPGVAPIVQRVAVESGLDRDAALQVFLGIFTCAHGFASLLANNALSYDEQQVADVLTSVFIGAVANIEPLPRSACPPEGEPHETAR